MWRGRVLQKNTFDMLSKRPLNAASLVQSRFEKLPTNLAAEPAN